MFGLNTGKYGPEKTPYLDTFHAVKNVCTSDEFNNNWFLLIDFETFDYLPALEQAKGVLKTLSKDPEDPCDGTFFAKTVRNVDFKPFITIAKKSILDV